MVVLQASLLTHLIDLWSASLEQDKVVKSGRSGLQPLCGVSVCMMVPTCLQGFRAFHSVPQGHNLAQRHSLSQDACHL
jgi:hypothetical protein